MRSIFSRVFERRKTLTLSKERKEAEIPARAFLLGLSLGMLALSGCINAKDASGASDATAISRAGTNPGDAGSNPQDPSGGTTPPTPVPTAQPSPPPPPARNYKVDALLFRGDGVWTAEANSIRSILNSHNATFEEVTSAELDAMSVDDLAKFGLLIFPGGSGGTQARSVSAGTHARLREAVQKRGVSYIGFCAGAFIAVAPAPAPGKDVSYGFGIVDGPELEYYYLENQGTDVEMTLLKLADGASKDILWYGGPITPDKKGGVIAKYPDGNPAISQMWSGNGFVVLSGVHPTATQSMLRSLGVSSSDGTHLDYAWTLIESALHRTPMPPFQ